MLAQDDRHTVRLFPKNHGIVLLNPAPKSLRQGIRRVTVRRRRQVSKMVGQLPDHQHFARILPQRLFQLGKIPHDTHAASPLFRPYSPDRPDVPLIFSHNLPISHSLRWIVFANKKEPVLSHFDKTGQTVISYTTR